MCGTSAHRVVAVVDDNESVRESLPPLLEAFGFATHAFAAAEEFLVPDAIGKTDCLVLEMPGMSGRTCIAY